jgi:HAD superfamily hydrolase (TIGR01509 family)
MIDVLMLDLGGTLVTGLPPLVTVLPGVPQALTDLGTLLTGAGQPLALCLVSDFTEPPLPARPDDVAAIMQQFLSILTGTGLQSFFAPHSKHITLSTHIGVSKPDCRIFQAALLRLGRPDVPLSNCLFVTESATHIAAARGFGMQALRFGSAGMPGVDFNAWSQAVSKISPFL